MEAENTTRSRDLLRLENKIIADEPSIFLIGRKPNDGSKPKTFKSGESSVLMKIKSFLPEMEKADAALKTIVERSPESVNIENVQDTDGPVIEMNLALVEYSGESESEDDNGQVGDSSSSDSEASDSNSGEDDRKKRQKTLIEEIQVNGESDEIK